MEATDTRSDASSSHANGNAESRKVRLQIDDKDVTTSYANAFRTNTSAEEVMLDFGLNMTSQGGKASDGSDLAGQIHFHIDRRVVMNFYTAKRLALALSQLVRQHEQRFGELELDVNKRNR